jgi:hypothetical protein
LIYQQNVELDLKINENNKTEESNKLVNGEESKKENEKANSKY